MDDVELPFGNIPAIWMRSAVIERIPNTRWFVERGGLVSFRHWLEEVHKANPGDLLPMQWAPQYVGVSRPAIRKRAISGRLTVFTFSVVVPVKTMLGRVEDRESRTTFDYLVKSECEAWRDELFDQREEEREAYFAERERRDRLLPKAHRKKGRKS